MRVEYHLDGSIDRRKDQRDVVMTYSYDNARRVTLEGALNLPGSVDGAIKSIGRAYDNQGRVEKITSYANSDGTGTVQNEI